DKQPLDLKDLPNTFLRRLWLLSEDARSTCCQTQLDPFNEDGKLPEEKLSSLEENAINPLDLVTSVFISADTFLQQEITVRMMQRKFAVPLVLPNADPEKPSQFLLWPLRGVLGQWRSHSRVTNGRVQNGNLASTPLPIISCIKLGRCSVSKSQVLNYVLTGPKSSKNIFIHKGMDGGQVPRRLSNGLVEIGWYLPTEDVDRDIYQAPFVISNLRGDASHHERCLKLVCQASSAVIIFCGDFKEKEKQLLESCKAMAKCLWLPKESVLPGSTLSVEKVANNLCEILKSWVPDNLKPVTLEAAAKLALDIGLNVDESPVCKNAMATVEEILKGLDEGSVEFQQKQLPLQGHLWHKLAELDKEESKHRKSEKETEPQLQEEKKDILPVNNEGSDVVQCIKTTQEEEQHLHNTENTTQHLESTPELSCSNEEQLYLEDSCEDAKALYSQSLESKTYNLGIEHFFREMGLIFELTRTSGSQNVLRLPKLAADLLLHGVPLELMDGDASNVPICWLGSIFAELNHSLHQEKLRTRVLTILGNHHARNAVVLSGLFGVELQEGWKRTSRGVYMAVLSLPDDCRKDLDYDLLLLIDVEGLGLASGGIETDMLIHDNMMATFAIGLSDVLLQNISPHAGEEIETTFKVMVSSLLRSKECGVFPICNLLVQDEGLDAVLQASQLRHVCKMLQTEDKGNVNNHYALNTSSTTFVKGPWPNMSLSETVDKQYTNDVLKLKETLFGALKRCSTKSEESDFIGRLSKVWDAVKSDSFSISLQNINMALGFSLLCTEFSQWEDGLLESMESWLMGATTKIIATKALDGTAQDALLSELKKEAQEEVKSEVHKLKSKAESYLMSEENLKMNSETFMPMLLSNMNKLQERASEEVMQKLETINESHCSLTQIEKFETSLEREQEFKLVALVETSKSTNILLQDHELEEEFESVWKKMCSSFDFRPSESDDISSSVADVLRQNLISRGLQKHMEKLNVVGQKQTSNFQVCDEHFGYRSRLKHMLEDNNKQQKLDAQKTANKIIEEYNKFSANKCSLAADFSESYITELLEMIENGLREKSLEIRSAFEVDLKIHLCNAACQDFQKLHDRFGKDKELLTYIYETKNKYVAEFIYQFRKRDQCQRVAQAFISMVIKPLVLAYINQPLGIQIAKEIENKAKQFQSPHAFHQSILEDLINEDCFESFEQYLLFYEDYRRTKINDTVVAHLADTTSLRKLKQQRLGEVVGQIAAAVSQTTEGASGVLSDTKPLLERVCLILEKDANINVEKESLNGPLFSITTDWDCFVKCLMELLATMHLGLSQDFNQNVDVLEVLNDLSILPQDHLLQIVRGCDKRCPLCKAPCDKVELDHEIHSSLLHRPKGILPRDICSPFHLSSSETSKDSHAEFMICKNLPLQDTNWSDVSDDLNSQKANNYWRYCLCLLFMKLAKFPEDWTKITKEEALDGLKEVFGRKECN
uniref:GTPase, very large interferon inducible 1-like 2 n=1 Tax=Xiphophorus couchianus TaxID=32473 RepID=A0A3B5M0R5_9TELE